MHVIFIYLGLLFGIFFEGEMIMISSVIAAHHGYLDLWLVIVIGIVGTFSSDLFYFSLGRKKGKVWLNRNQKIEEKVKFVRKRIEKYPVLIFIIYRFAYGLRSLTPAVIGTSETKERKFIVYSLISIIVWALFYASVGYAFGELIKSQLSHIEHIEKYIIGFLVLAGLIIIPLLYSKRKAITQN